MSSLPLPSLDTTTASKLLPALQHATSGSVGTLISTCALYPLSLVVTRLQVQRQLQREGRAGREAGPATGEPSLSATARSTTRGDPTDPTSAAPAYAANATAAATASATANAAATRSSQQKHHQNHLHQQHQNLKSSSAAPSDYDGIADAFSKIYATEGGVKALYTGLASDAVRSLLDSFLFFMFYEWFRGIRLAASYKRKRGKGGLGALEELAIGVAAGACCRALTAPISNIITRKQAASMVSGPEGAARGIGDIVRRMKAERGGYRGLWAGLSASLVLSLNPSITFFLQNLLRRKVVSKERADNPGAFLTFLMAATSKAAASAITYPFHTAKTRLQSGLAAGEAEDEEDLISLEDRDVDREVEGKLKAARAARQASRRSIFGTLTHIARTEGVGSLYDGLQTELLRGFLCHGTTMVAKDAVQKLLFKLYFLVATLLSEHRLRRRARGNNKGRKVEITTTMEEEVVMSPERSWFGKDKPRSADKPAKHKPKPILLPEQIEQSRPMEQDFLPPPTHRSPAFEQYPSPRRSPAFVEQPLPTAQRSAFPGEPTPRTAVPAFEPPPSSRRSPFELWKPGMGGVDDAPAPSPLPPGIADRGMVMSPLPPALQYRMPPPGSPARRNASSVPKTPVIMNMFDKSHRELK
ncbi:hypothetical protein SLS62_008232 [Diatrype stigma]|uniref:Uncharacterized protein n=1 Tax=Diatrype stigma TaxID=117547 RepID=A0AAN9UKM8_9PEZI